MNCCFCGKHVDSIEEAVELCWYPSFWQGDTNYQGPVCPDCLQEHLFTDECGEYELKPGHILPPSAESLGATQEPLLSDIRPKFPLGHIVATPGALEALADSGQTPDFFLEKHVQGDWGEVCSEDKRLNDEALINGDRLLSAYRTLKNIRLWLITEADRSSSCLLKPEEY